MEKIHFESIIKSFFLGLFIGVILEFYNNEDMLFVYKVLTVLASGSIGFLIGLITEWLTSILPITMAKARVYFFINSIIALCVTTVIMVSLLLMTGSYVKYDDFILVLLIILVIISIANLFDYMMYRRAQNKLKTFKELIEDE